MHGHALWPTRRQVLRAAGISVAGALVAGSREAEAAAVAGKATMLSTDVCVYGGTSAGVMAAVQVHRMGYRAVVVDPSRRLGGMTTNGLGETDSGDRAAIGGLARAFYASVHEYYRHRYGPDSPQVRECREGYRFEPHVAEHVLRELVARTGVPVFHRQHLTDVSKRNNRIVEVRTDAGDAFRAQVFIDASYEGDLMAAAGVSHTVGREANAKYGETLNGVHFGDPNHNFKVPVDPYVRPGESTSGLLQGVSGEDPGRQGEGDHRVQAYCFRLCLTSVPENRAPFPRPEGYDADRYTLLARYLQAGVWDALALSTPLPNGKTDTNNHGGFSTDNIGRNYGYPDGDQETRDRIYRDHIAYQQGLLWFLCNDERVPPAIRQEVGRWGLPRDEFNENDGWPHELYIREARRMVAEYVVTEHDCRGDVMARDSVGVASYGMDSHNCQRVVVDGHARNEGNVEAPVARPYGIAYQAIVPRESQCRNLLVPVCLSASHIAYGSIRMEPVFMVLGQSAGTAAAHAIRERRAVQQIDQAQLAARLRQDDQVLELEPNRGRW